MTRDETIERAKAALALWDRYQPNISTDQVIEQAIDVAEALRAVLAASPLAPEGGYNAN